MWFTLCTTLSHIHYDKLNWLFLPHSHSKAHVPPVLLNLCLFGSFCHLDFGFNITQVSCLSNLNWWFSHSLITFHKLLFFLFAFYNTCSITPIHTYAHMPNPTRNFLACRFSSCHMLGLKTSMYVVVTNR